MSDDDGDVLETSPDGHSSVRLVHDDDAPNPRTDYNHLGHAITSRELNYAGQFLDIDDEGIGPLEDIWAECRSLTVKWSDAVDLFERYARTYHVAVTYSDSSADGPAAVWYLAAEDFWQVDNPLEYLKQEAQEYRSWAEGDTWGYVISHDDDGYDVDDSCWGFIGREYAEEAAREALAASQ